MQTIDRGSTLSLAPQPFRNRLATVAPGSVRKQPPTEVVHLVEPDGAIREELLQFLLSEGIPAEAFASAAEFFVSTRAETAACVILNIELPDISALEVQRRIMEDSNKPIIFIGDPGDVASTVHAMKAGAVDFFTRPFDLNALMTAVRRAFAQDRKNRQRRAELAALKERLSRLTPREREVLPLVVGGLLNKQAASLLGISEVTLQIHRSQVTRKMQAESFADLVRMAIKLRIPYWRDRSAQPGMEQDVFLAGNSRMTNGLSFSGAR